MFLAIAAVLANEPVLTRGTRLERPDGEVPVEATPAPRATLAQHQWVDTVITQNYDRVLDCYREALARDPATAGVIELELEMAPDGHPAWVQLSQSTHGDAVLDACVANMVLATDFSRVDRHEAFVVRHALVLVPLSYPSKRQLMAKNEEFVTSCAAGREDLRGIVELRFRASSGRLVAPTLSLNTTDDAEFAACLEASLPSWRIARSVSGPVVLVMRVVPEQPLKVYLPD